MTTNNSNTNTFARFTLHLQRSSHKTALKCATNKMKQTCFTVLSAGQINLDELVLDTLKKSLTHCYYYQFGYLLH